MKYYAGIDVSLESATICVVDEQRLIVRKDKVAREPEGLIGWRLGARHRQAGREQEVQGRLGRASWPSSCIAGGWTGSRSTQPELLAPPQPDTKEAFYRSGGPTINRSRRGLVAGTMIRSGREARSSTRNMVTAPQRWTDLVPTNLIMWRPSADHGQKQVPGEDQTSRGMISQGPLQKWRAPSNESPQPTPIERNEALPVPLGSRLVVAPAFREGEAVVDAGVDFEFASRT
ncbi:hypothetical protein SAMN02990966_00636 [Rhodospirillales bacterium URHD0017]|nr:hypothetical protein SAMN02990966_00636 [Rhodospirillales bacterium URHD0017]